jgi:hypothetical protein
MSLVRLDTYVILRLGGKFIVEIHFLSFLFSHWSIYGIRAWLFFKEGEIEVTFYKFFKYLKHWLCFWFFNFCYKFQSSRCFAFWYLFYSQSWHPFFKPKVLKSWMTIIFIHGRWRWNFFHMKKICEISL